MIKQIRIFLDCEFTHLGKDAELLSIAMVTEYGEELYLEISDAVDTNAYKNLGNDQRQWIDEHVIANFFGVGDNYSMTGKYKKLKQADCRPVIEEWLLEILKKHNKDTIVFWGDVPAYDWVLICDLWGGARKMPEHIHYIIRDLATMLELKGIPADRPRMSLLNEKILGKLHNALYDARVLKKIWEKYGK